MNRLGRVVQGHFKKATKDADEYIIYALNPDKITEVWVLLRNMGGEYDEWKDGHFLFKLTVPEGFPNDPPSFYAQHENGVYGVNVKCCISVGEYHRNDYRAVLGIRGFATELANGMMNWEYLTELGGINLLSTDQYKKKEIAKGSFGVIKSKFSRIYDLLDDSFAVYSAKWDIDKCNDATRMRLSFGRTQFPLRHDGTIDNYTADMLYEKDVDLSFLIPPALPQSNGTASVSEQLVANLQQLEVMTSVNP